ncbi:nicotinate (nicotinamide) nucleotide adenylyltransferase [Anaerococcus sp. ENR1011]|uniref:Probable nicotinate-nucleotide adenylyltransferase n=1 Tax=Anaerococcus groningensis TaxID=3115616 RepID=A0ABW9N2C9_9FIRM
MKIGLYGGTFDPIHIGHLIVMENTLNFMDLDKIIVLPSSNPPHKQNKKKTTTNIRVEMVKAAIKDNEKLELSTFESHDDSVVYTHQTLDYFKNKYPDDEFYYIMGEDSFMTIDSWRNYEKILNDNLIVFARTSIEEDSDLVKKVDFIKKDNANIYLIDNLNINISSTLIRDLVKNNKSIKYLVPDSVRELIKEYGLYV